MAFAWAISNAHQCSLSMDKNNFEIGPLLDHQICLRLMGDTLLFMKKLGTVLPINYLPLKKDWLKGAVHLLSLPYPNWMRLSQVFLLHGRDNLNLVQRRAVLATHNPLYSAYFSSLWVTSVSDFQQYFKVTLLKLLKASHFAYCVELARYD